MFPNNKDFNHFSNSTAPKNKYIKCISTHVDLILNKINDIELFLHYENIDVSAIVEKLNLI